MRMMFKIAFKNFKQCIKDYIIYLLTLTLVISLFYSFLSLSSKEYTLITSTQIDLKNLYSFLKYTGILISFILIFIVKYTNDYMIKIRSKEFSIYLILGIRRQAIGFMFLIEETFLGLISLIFGVFLGSILSTILSKIILNFIGEISQLSFNLFFDTSMYTAIFFIILYGVMFILNYLKFKKVKILDLIKRTTKYDSKNIKDKKFYNIIFLVFLFSIGYAILKVYKYISICHLSDVSAEFKNFILFQIVICIIVAIFSLVYLISYLLNFVNLKRI